MVVHRWLAGLLALALLPVSAARAGEPSTTVARTTSLTAGGYLKHDQQLVSRNGRYVAAVGSRGRLVVRTSAGTVLWRSPATGAGAYLLLARTGQVSVRVAGRARWATHTSGSGSRNVLTMRDDGVLALTAGGLTVWSTRLPYACPAVARKLVVVDISRQWARMCRNGQQIRATFVTTGASAHGYATPTGTWRMNAFRKRNTTLYPAAGGRYPVKFWLPYDGNVYGLHDSSWQKFPYGSGRYRTQGSHGCVHVPVAMMRWLYAWAPVGTRITVHR